LPARPRTESARRPLAQPDRHPGRRRPPGRGAHRSRPAHRAHPRLQRARHHPPSHPPRPGIACGEGGARGGRRLHRRHLGDPAVPGGGQAPRRASGLPPAERRQGRGHPGRHSPHPRRLGGDSGRRSGVRPGGVSPPAPSGPGGRGRDRLRKPVPAGTTPHAPAQSGHQLAACPHGAPALRRPPHGRATCYKLFRTSVLRSLPLACQRFEFCPEVTAKALRRGHRIVEVAISYEPRTIAQGKKIRWHDGVVAIWTLLRLRFWRG